MLKPHPCEYCGEIIPIQERFKPSSCHWHYNNQRFCDRSCAIKARKAATAAKPERNICSVPHCASYVGEDLMMLCTWCHENASDIEELPTGNWNEEDNLTHQGSIEHIIDGMKDTLKERATILSAKDYSQEELAYYLEYGELPTLTS